MKNRTKALLATPVAMLALAACGQSFTFEAVPAGMNEDQVEQGVDEKQMDGISCFVIEADSNTSDGNDRQLGGFISVEAAEDPDAVAECKNKADAQAAAEAQDD